jgi:glycerate-2-kinase
MPLERTNYILNREGLTSHGNVSLRNAAIDVIEHGLRVANPYWAVKRLLQLKGDVLQVGNLELDLNKYERIFIIGTGKASLGIAQALEEILGDHISDGLFVLRHGSKADLTYIRVIYASHPYPDENSYRGGQLMMELAKTFTERDLVFAGITGGSSALMVLPADGIPFEDIQKVNKLLLLSGADIVAINTIRKHLSKIKGGWLAAEILPATLVNLTVSDVVGDMLDYITCPTVPDASTFDDARRIMDMYNLWDKFPTSAREYLRKGGSAQETPKDFGDLPVYTFVVVPGDAACVGAYERAKELGFNGLFLTSMLTGEAKESGAMFASIAKEVVLKGRPMASPCAVIAGGENVVTIGVESNGRGGPNQEFALSAGLEINGFDRIAIASIDTDGIDGVADAAGGLVDGSTWAAVKSKGIDPLMALRRHDSNQVLHQVGDSVITGFTGTNVNDIKLLLVE